MSLSPHQLADILVRQGLITGDQGDTIRKEARLLPTRRRSARAFEQKAHAYELIEGLKFPNLKNGGTVGELEIARAIAEDAKLPHMRIDTLALSADLIESKISRPFAKRYRMIPVEMSNGKLKVAVRQSLRHRGHRQLPPHRRPRPRAGGRLRARYPEGASPSSTACAIRSSAPSAT